MCNLQLNNTIKTNPIFIILNKYQYVFFTMKRKKTKLTSRIPYCYLLHFFISACTKMILYIMRTASLRLVPQSIYRYAKKAVSQPWGWCLWLFKTHTVSLK